MPVPVYALLIGNNDYKHHKFPKLLGAIADCESIEQYLTVDLQVPANNVITLLNAKRSEIINHLLALRNDPRFPAGSAFIIYYAGHGASDDEDNTDTKSPKQRIQGLVPSDYNGTSINIIPDRTIAGLLRGLADAKGDNITVILDCCYSGSGTRNLVNTELTRGVSLDKPVSADIDKDILGKSRGMAVPNSHFGLSSHVLLSACKSTETAREKGGKGKFTSALIETLKKLALQRTTYTDLIIGFPDLKTQSPQCEGVNRDRIIFDGKVVQNLTPVHKLSRNKEREYEIPVGTAFGVTKSSTFSIYSSSQDARLGKSLDGQCKVARIELFKTVLDLSKLTKFDSESPVAVLNMHGGNETFIVRVPKMDGLRQGVTLNMVSKGMEEKTTRPIHFSSSKGLFEARSHGGELYFQSLDEKILGEGFQSGLSISGYQLRDIVNVLHSAAKFDYHLRRSDCPKVLSKDIEVNFYRLEDVQGDLDSGFVTKYQPQGQNLLKGNRVEVKIEPFSNASYGMEIINKTCTPLYASAFYFDHTDLSIVPYYVPAIAAGELDPCVPANSSLTIGYGSGGAPPFYYHLSPEQNIDVGTVKVFISTEPVDMSHVPQKSPLGWRGGGPQDKRSSVKPWGQTSFIVVQKRGR